MSEMERCSVCGKAHSPNLVTFAWHEFQAEMARTGHKGTLDETSYVHGFVAAVMLVSVLRERAGEVSEKHCQRLLDHAEEFAEEMEASL